MRCRLARDACSPFSQIFPLTRPATDCMARTSSSVLLPAPAPKTQSRDYRDRSYTCLSSRGLCCKWCRLNCMKLMVCALQGEHLYIDAQAAAFSSRSNPAGVDIVQDSLAQGWQRNRT